MDRRVQGVPGADGQSGLDPTDGAAGQDASAILSRLRGALNSTEAIGGNGGNGGNYTGPNQNIAGGNGGDGGAAESQVRATLTLHASTTATASATGGTGGNGGLDFSFGGAGGNATAEARETDRFGATNASALAEAGDAGASIDADGRTGGNSDHTNAWSIGANASAWARSEAGAGGASSGDLAGLSAGGGGIASATHAVAIGITHALAMTDQFGGIGGDGSGTANGGNGASSSLNDAVSGISQHGSLVLQQTAWAGHGGNSANGDGGRAGDATSSLTVDDTLQPYAYQSSFLDTSSAAMGASQIGGGAGRNPGAAGTATAICNTTANSTAEIFGGAYALGSHGGNEQIGFAGNGAGGGIARALGVATGGTVNLSVGSVGGDGGIGRGASQAGGDGGASSATAIADGIAGATCGLGVSGGNGGAGLEGARGGDGAAIELANAAFAKSAGGTLSLDQGAYGGSGGASDTGPGGDGGDAASSLSVSNNVCSNVNVEVHALAGDGGIGGGGNGASGSATAATSVQASATVWTFADAESGTFYGPAPGSASAHATASGSLVSVRSVADSWAGGPAIATSTGTAVTGSVGALAQSGNASYGQPVEPVLVYGASAYGTAAIDTQASVQSEIIQGGTAPAFTTSLAAVSELLEAPETSSPAVSDVLSANPTIASAFGADPQIFGLAETGAAHPTAGSASEQSQSDTTLDVNLAMLSGAGDLTLGLYDGQSVGAGITRLTLDVTSLEHGNSLLALTFNGPHAASHAVAAFSDKAYDLGRLTPDGTLGLDIRLTVTSDAPSSGFYGEWIVGNAADLAHAAPHSRAEDGHWLHLSDAMPGVF